MDICDVCLHLPISSVNKSTGPSCPCGIAHASRWLCFVARYGYNTRACILPITIVAQSSIVALLGTEKKGNTVEPMPHLSSMFLQSYIRTYVCMYSQTLLVCTRVSKYSWIVSTYCSVPTSCNIIEITLYSKCIPLIVSTYFSFR